MVESYPTVYKPLIAYPFLVFSLASLYFVKIISLTHSNTKEMRVFSTYCWPRCSRSVGYMNGYIHGFTSYKICPRHLSPPYVHH